MLISCPSFIFSPSLSFSSSFNSFLCFSYSERSIICLLNQSSYNFRVLLSGITNRTFLPFLIGPQSLLSSFLTIPVGTTFVTCALVKLKYTPQRTSQRGRQPNPELCAGLPGAFFPSVNPTRWRAIHIGGRRPTPCLPSASHHPHRCTAKVRLLLPVQNFSPSLLKAFPEILGVHRAHT